MTETAQIPSFSDCYIGRDEDDITHHIFDSRYTPRATAINTVVCDYGIDFKDARCTTTYCRWLSRQERWDNGGSEQWLDNHGHFENRRWIHDGPDEAPDEPPVDWDPGSEFGAFEECVAGAPGAVKCWKVETGL